MAILAKTVAHMHIRSKLPILAVLIIVLFCGCTASVEESAPPAVELSIEPSVEPAPESTPRVLLDYSDCAEYVRYDAPESVTCHIKLTSTNPGDWEDFELDCEIGESSETHSENAYRLRRGWNGSDMSSMVYTDIDPDSSDGQYIAEVLANADFVEDESIGAYVYVGIEVTDLASGDCWLFLPEGKVIRDGEPNSAAEVGVEAYARLSVITWKNWTHLWSSIGGVESWLHYRTSDESAEYYMMCVQTEQEHVHLTLEEAREFVKVLCPTFDRDDISTYPSSRELSPLGWDAYDGYVRIDEYFGDTARLDENGDTVVETEHHFVFSDNSLACWKFGTRFMYSCLAYPKVGETVVEIIDSVVPRASYIASDFADYDAALTWIDDRFGN